MAKRPGRRAGGESSGGAGEPRAISPPDAAIDSLMGLLAERRFHEIGLHDIAERAGLSLSGLRAAFSGKVHILAAFFERMDGAVLARGPAEGEGERDRLFDVLMRRVDALTPYRAGLKNLSRSTMRDPALAAAMALMSDRSMKWMLAGAQVTHSGILGRLTNTGVNMVFAQAMATWLDDDDPHNEKTMAALDRGLRRGERAYGYIRDACSFVLSFGRRSRTSDAGDAEAMG